MALCLSVSLLNSRLSTETMAEHNYIIRPELEEDEEEEQDETPSKRALLHFLLSSLLTKKPTKPGVAALLTPSPPPFIFTEFNVFVKDGGMMLARIEALQMIVET